MEFAAFPLSDSKSQLSRLCFGTSFHSSDFEELVQTFKLALESGINFIDTAESYGDGLAETLLGDVLGENRRNIVIASKFSLDNDDPKSIRPKLERSLKRLRSDYLDLYQQHWPPKSWLINDCLQELEKLKQEGKIRALGVSNWMEPEWNVTASPFRIDSLQSCYNLLWRTIEPNVLPLCHRHKIAVLAYSPLAQGLLAGRYKAFDFPVDDIRRSNRLFREEKLPAILSMVQLLTEIGKPYSKKPGQVAMRWLLDQPDVTSVVVGSSKREQLLENLATMDWKLSLTDLTTITKASDAFQNQFGPPENSYDASPLYERAFE